jgi:hypothetical protein
MSYKYIYLDDMGYCCGEFVWSPTYCTNFQWEMPDLSGTEAKLIGYNIYYYVTPYYYNGMEIPDAEVNLIAQTTNTYWEEEIGIMGVVWVTAVYSDPEGESQPSNFVVNGELPTSIQQVGRQDLSIIYNKHRNNIEILGIKDITSVSIVRIDGIIIRSVFSSDFHSVDTKGIEKGIYMIHITIKDAESIRGKIMIK